MRDVGRLLVRVQGSSENLALPCDDALVLYEDECSAVRSFASRTRREYLTDLRQLGECLGKAGVVTVQLVQRANPEGFLAHLDHQALTDSIRRRKLAAVGSTFQFLADAGCRTGNPVADVMPPRLERSQARYLTQREYEWL